MSDELSVPPNGVKGSSARTSLISARRNLKRCRQFGPWTDYAAMPVRIQRAGALGRLLLLAVFLFASLTEPVGAHVFTAAAAPSRSELRLEGETPCQTETAYPAIFVPQEQPSIGFVAHADPVNGSDPSGNYTTTEVTSASKINVGLSIWATATLTQAAVSVKHGIDIHGLANRLGVKVKYEEREPQYLYFLHGTSLKTWGPSLTIDPELGTGKDFGRGFYTFADNSDGRFWAGDWARQSTHGLLDIPIVIVVKIRRADFESLTKKDFRNPALASAWQPFVKMCRTGRRNYGGAGVIIGPVSNGNDLYPEVHPSIEIPQFKFESGVSKLKFGYVYPAWRYMEASQ